jgi:hypothetical protein
MLTKNIQELTIPRPGRPQIWCTRCYTEGHLVNEFLCMRGMVPPHNLMGPYPVPMGGVAKVYLNPPFHALGIYHTFPVTQTSHPTENCKIFQTHGHEPRQFPIMQKYTNVPNTIHSKFCAYRKHSTNKCRVLDALADRLDSTSFRINETPQGPGRGHGGGFGGGFRGERHRGRSTIDVTTEMKKVTW